MNQKIFDRYFGPMVRHAALAEWQQAVVALAFDLALGDLEGNDVPAADVDALEKRIVAQDAGLAMMDEKLHDAQQALATVTEDRNRLKRQLADLENTIEHVREAEMLRTTATIAKPGDMGTPLLNTINVVPDGTITVPANGHSHTIQRATVEKPKRVDFAGTNVELREQVFAAFQSFHRQNGRAPSYADWKQIRLEAQLPSANTIENRLGMAWTAVAKAAGLEPNAKFNSRTEGKADNAEATFPS